MPLIAQWVGRIPPGTASPLWAATVDLLPTFLAAAGLHRPASMRLDGYSLLPALLQPEVTAARLAKASKAHHAKQHKAGAGHGNGHSHGNGNGTATHGHLHGVGGIFAVPIHRRSLLATTAAAAAAAGTAGAFQSALAAAGAAAATTASAAVAAAGTSLASAARSSSSGASAPVASIVDHYHSRVFLWHKVAYTFTRSTY